LSLVTSAATEIRILPDEGEGAVRAEAGADPGDGVGVGPGLTGDVLEEGGEFGVKTGGIVTVVIQADGGQAEFGHLAEVITIGHKAATVPMGVDDHGTAANGLGQDGDALKGLVIGGFESKPVAGEGVLGFGPEQGAEEEEEGQDRDEL